MATGNYSYWKNCLTMIRAGTGITVDNSDPMKPIINATGGGGGGGIESVVAGDNVTVDDTDPLNPIINAGGGLPFKTIMWTAYATSSDEADLHFNVEYNDTGRTLSWNNDWSRFQLNGTYNNIWSITSLPVSTWMWPIPISESLIGCNFEEGVTNISACTGSSDYAMRIEIRIYE